MRFMMIMIPNVSEDEWPSDPEAMAEMDEFVAMGKYNDELIKAGVLLAVDGLAAHRQGRARRLRRR